MTPVSVGLVSVVLVFVLLFLRMPVAFVMLVVGMGGYALLTSVPAVLTLTVQTMYSSFASYSLIVIPLFVWMGHIAFYSGLSARIYDAIYKITGRSKGSLALATIAACAAFGAICGSTTATAATMSAVALPEMKKRRYKPSFATATVASAAILGVMIPPSVIFILYGTATGESISQLFLAGILPGLLLTGLFMLAAYLQVLRDPPPDDDIARIPLKEKLKALANGGFEVVVIFIVVMGGLFAGIFTPTEAGGVGAFATLAVAAMRRDLSWRSFVSSLDVTVRLSAMIMFLVASATVYGRFLAITGLPTALAGWAVALPLSPNAILSVILLIYLILGCFIDALALILLTVPIFYPVAVTLGFD
ncbi:MAG: TRAP transporter large permease, partial [Gemmiger sp.]|nr:TRAP transporter large permease [Gemmiger sp.]